MNTTTTTTTAAQARRALRANAARYLRKIGPVARREFYRAYGCGPFFNPAAAGGDATPDRQRPQGWGTH